MNLDPHEAANTGPGPGPGPGSTSRHAAVPRIRLNAPPATASLRHKPGIADLLALGLLLPLAGFMIWHASHFVRASFQAMEARWFVSMWVSGDQRVTVPAWMRVRDEIDAALATTSDDADLHRLQGMVYTLAALNFETGSDDPLEFRRDAVRHQRLALASRPHDGWAWVELAESLRAIDPADPRVWRSWQLARDFGPFEPGVRFGLYKVGFKAWNVAPADVKSWMRDTYRDATPGQRKQVDELGAAFAPQAWPAEVARMGLP